MSISELKHLWHENIAPLDKTDKNHPVLSWIHIEGRNCEVLLRVLETITTPDNLPVIGNMSHRKMISVDFERPGRKGLRELLPFADVAFVSKDYANFIAMQEDVGSSQLLANSDMVCRFLGSTRDELMDTTVGYITVGSEGCYVFVSQTSTYARLAVPWENGRWETGWLYIHLPVSNDISSSGPVVGTTGAGDTFIAAVIYGLGVLKLNPVEAGKLGNVVAGRKCLQAGYEGIWKDVEIAS